MGPYRNVQITNDKDEDHLGGCIQANQQVSVRTALQLPDDR
jgi:hypothetical protein